MELVCEGKLPFGKGVEILEIAKRNFSLSVVPTKSPSSNSPTKNSKRNFGRNLILRSTWIDPKLIDQMLESLGVK